MDYDPPVPPPPLPPPTSVAARFVSQTTLDAAKANREAEWKAMHEKLGQEAPVYKEKGEGEEYDGRSLWEKLQEHKDKKQEAFDEQIKFKNQFRALDEDEISFLDSLVDDNFEEEDRKRELIKEELADFRKAVISRGSLAPPPVVSAPHLSVSPTPTNALASTSSLPSAASLAGATTPSSSVAASTTSLAGKAKSKKKDFQKSFLKGVVLAKKGGSAKRKGSDASNTVATSGGGSGSPPNPGGSSKSSV